ncbi:hypothetical protein B0H19DRAFT_1227564 [Mycena capillaripes]|nr:hypothetical protein B0H19DRAFT_1227564 [Mycena capillaripes]
MSAQVSGTEITDPNYLAFVACGFDEINRAGERHKTQTPLVKRHWATILDSFAYILVSEAQNQVVAVGAEVLPGKSPPLRILVAENRDVLPGVIEHLQSIFHHLGEIHAKRPEREGSRQVTLLGSPPTSEYESELCGLELTIIRYSWGKFKQRFLKKDRYQNIIDTGMEAIGMAADHRQDLSEEEKSSLAGLQKSRDFDRDKVANFVTDIGIMANCLASRPSEQNIGKVRLFLHLLFKSRRYLHGRLGFVALWNSYIEVRLRTKGKEPKKRLDIIHWLSKIVSICEHYLSIADIAASATLAQILLQGVEFVKIPNPSRNLPISLDSSTMERILQAAQCEIETAETKSVDDFLQLLLEKAHPGANLKLTDGKFEGRIRPVHCECQILVNLHNSSAIPYVGVSKLSCAFCDIYFAAYRSVTNIKICTRGTHSHTALWRCPQLADPVVDGKIRADVCSQILEEIARGWKLYRRASLASQITGASGGESERELEDLEPEIVKEERAAWMARMLPNE